MKLNVILDSHKGEILNLLLAVSFWNRNEKQLKKINIIYIGSFNNWMLIQEYLKIIKSISNVKVSFFEIESLSISKVKRIKNAILLYYNILLLRIKSNLFFVPYDQRSFFYNFLSLLKCKSIALPHTTGLEVYSKGVFNYKLRNDKKIPVLAKIEGCEEYFNSLGFSKIIYGGSFVNKHRSDQVFKNLIKSNNKEKSVYVFTLARNSKQYKKTEWEQTHLSLFNALKNAKVQDIYIGAHPSQDLNDLNYLVSIAKEKSINVDISMIDSLRATNLSSRFISILTSAGQMPFLMGKTVCGFALKEMRNSVKDFGIDPYPYNAIGVEDFTTETELESWLVKDETNISKYPTSILTPMEINNIINAI